MKKRKELALIILEKLIEKDNFGRPLKSGAPILFSDLWSCLYTKENVDYDYLCAITKSLHCDHLINLNSTEYHLDDAKITLGKRGLDYYNEKTREFN